MVFLPQLALTARATGSIVLAPTLPPWALCILALSPVAASAGGGAPRLNPQRSAKAIRKERSVFSLASCRRFCKWWQPSGGETWWAAFLNLHLPDLSLTTS